MLKKYLMDPPKKYRPIPFWSWNEKLHTDETAWQIEQMEQAGIGGYFMHARGGLQTEYMGEEWMDNIKCGIHEGEKRGMGAWGYDENGWPSGFGGGIVNGLGIKYQQKYLRYEIVETKKDGPFTICCLPFESKWIHMYYDVNPFYVDTLDAEVIAKFIEVIHVTYKKELGEDFKKMAGFFTDEPQISRNGIPWSLILPVSYRERYQEDLIPLLPALFFEVEGYERIRFRFWQLVRDLFTNAFCKQIYNWCETNGSQLTGHMVLEESMESQLISNGACMPNYEYMHIPGMDWLGREIGPSTTAVQVASVAHQTGKKQVLSETFALCGWDVSFEELKQIYEWQMVRGINLLCQHLEGYSLRGIRKRDYPATLFYQQPWWSEYRKLNDVFSRLGMLLSEGKVKFETLVVHPMSSAWICFNNKDNGLLRELDEKFMQTIHSLEENQIQYDLGDERIMQLHGSVTGNVLNVGQMSYRVVLVPDALNLAPETVDLLEQFQANGGKIIFSERIPEMVGGEPSDRVKQLAEKCLITDSLQAMADAVPFDVRPIRMEEKNGILSGVASTVRYFDEEGMVMYYIVNTSQEKRELCIGFAGKSVGKFDYCSGEILPIAQTEQNGQVSVEVSLAGMGSVVLFAYQEEKPELTAAGTRLLEPINQQLGAVWQIAESDPNAVTLDYCDYYFDGVLQEKQVPVNNIQGEACKLERPVDVDLVFYLNVMQKPHTPLYLVLETPEKFAISVNGNKIPNVDCGYYRDKSFRKIDISDAVIVGENEIKLSIHFTQSEKIYENIKKSLQFESEKNMLTYDTEIEAVYVIGDFGVDTAGEFTELDRRAVRYDGSFAISDMPKTVTVGNFVLQKFPFFNGRMVLKNTVTLNAKECVNRSLLFAKRCSTVVKVRVNGADAGTILWQPYEVDLSGLLHEGENEIEVEIIGNLRNLLGPHHLKEGECYFVCPNSFFEDSDVWCGGKNPGWDDRYCFVEYGLYL